MPLEDIVARPGAGMAAASSRMIADPQLVAALEALWRIPRPGPNNLTSAPAFVALSELCEARYGRGKARFALSTALRSLGLPCTLPATHAGLPLDPERAALALDRAFTQTRTVRRHLCPLDLASELPPLTFGKSRVGRFSAAELETLFDAPRLARDFPNRPLDAGRLAQFHWLVVEEDIEVDPRPDARSAPVLFGDMRRDLGEIEPLLGRFPPVVEAALFFLLLAPWEDAICRAVLDGGQFNKFKDRDGEKMSDAYLRKKLAVTHPWIDPVYQRTSDFVHLSGKHFEVSIARADDDTRTAYLQISGHDPQRPQETYFEAIDTFLEATRLAGMLILAFLTAQHRPNRVLAPAAAAPDGTQG